MYKLYRNRSTKHTDNDVQIHRTWSIKFIQEKKVYKVHKTGSIEHTEGVQSTQIRYTKNIEHKVQSTVAAKVQVHRKQSTKIYRTESTKFTEVGVQSKLNRMYRVYRIRSTKKVYQNISI